MGSLAVELKQYDRASEYYDVALKLARKFGNLEMESQILFGLGDLYLSQQKHNQAADYYQQVLSIATEIGSPVRLAPTWDKLSQLAVLNNNVNAAIFYGKQAINTIQALRTNIHTMEPHLQTSFLKVKAEVYENLADLLIEQGRLTEAQQVLAMLKEDEYFNFIRRTRGDGEPRTQTTLTTREAAKLTAYNALKNELIVLAQEYNALIKISSDELTPEQQQRKQVLRDGLKTSRAGFRAFLTQLELNFAQVTSVEREQFDDKQLRQLTSLQGVLKQLGEGTVLIHYLSTQDKLHIILTTPTAILNREVSVERAALNTSIFKLKQRIATQGAFGSVYEPAQQLYDWMMQPIAEDLAQAKAKVLMLYLDGALRYVPVAALFDGKQWLAERYATSVYTAASAPNLVIPTQPNWRVAGLGLSEKRGDYNPLPSVENELDGIVRRDASDPTGVLDGVIRLNQDFTLEALQDVLEDDFPVVHIASHFVFQPGRDTDSFLLLGDGSKLTLAQVVEEQFYFHNTDLLTLSACDTAASDASNGSEVEGLGTLVQQQGARSVLATLWSVDDEGTSVFMQQLYQTRLDNAVSKARALQQVQQQFIQASTSDKYPKYYAKPYYWAPFILMGNWL
ncbi:MAG: CHAT domain-containing protein [Pseudomonadota bacterium]